MFEEMVKEVQEEGAKFEKVMTLPFKLEEKLNEELDIPEYSQELDIPYGNYKCELRYRLASAEPGDENWELKEAETKAIEYFHHGCEPIPISREQQQELDDKEEKENKERENEARNA
jgi:hypothetical protein